MAYLLSSPSSPSKERQPGLMCSILCLNSAQGGGAAGRAPLLTFAVVLAQASAEHKEIAVLLRLHIPLAKLPFFSSSKRG